MKKAGFVTIVGRSNVGKSTLLNSLLGTKISIVTDKPQTTRLPIKGILNEARGQIIFVDTPGLYHKTKDLLTSKLNSLIYQELEGTDLAIYLADPGKPIGNEEHELLRALEHLPKEKKFLVLNKMDLATHPYIHEYESLADHFAKMIKVSAAEEMGLTDLVDAIFEILPEHELYFDEHQMTDLPSTDWMAEVIREKCYQYLHDEVPYTTQVRIDSYGKDKKIYKIEATILTNDERYKPMIIGAGGQKIRDIGSAARKEMELAMGTKIFLHLNVETDPHWAERLGKISAN